MSELDSDMWKQSDNQNKPEEEQTEGEVQK